VHDWIRALTWPYPGAFAYLAGRKVMLWASAVGGYHAGGSAGEVLGWDADGVRVGTADGVLLLTRASLSDEVPGPAVGWAEHSGLGPGDRFEPVPRETAIWALDLGPLAFEPTGELAR
jgi:methionyl-tRNA formyltransferase